jgi:hypothetical protein
MIDFLDFENFHDELLDGVRLFLRFVPFIPRWKASNPFTRGFGGCDKVFLLGENTGTGAYHSRS